jgi:putative MATE family efflux protein
VADFEDVDDPEGAPALPSASLAAAAARPESVPLAHPGRPGPEIWQLAWPVMLSMLLVNTVSIVDVAMVGRLGADAMAAVGYATQFHFLAQSVLLLWVAAVTALVIVVAVLAAPRLWLGWLGAEPGVTELTIPYLNLVLGSSLLLAVAMTLENALRANRDTRTPMWIATVVAVVKILLNALLIFGTLGFPRLELVGAGLATLGSQLVGLLLFGAAARRAPESSPLALRPRDLREARPLLREVVRLSLPGVGERLAMNLALLAYFRVLAEYGTVAIAAYTVGIRLLSFSWIPGTGFGAASATMVGQALGAGDPRAAARAGWHATRLAVGVALLLGALCVVARTPLARLFIDDAATVATLGPFLLCLALAQPFLQAHFALGGAHRGAGDTWTPFLAAAAGNWALRVPLAVLFAYVLELDLVWVWYALVFDHATRTAWLAWSFRRGSWLRARA